MKNVQKTLDSLASPIPSKWREKAEWRKANRQWLKKSQKIALTILECLSLNKIKQKELSKKLGVSEQYISRILKGSENLSLETISKIESALGIEIISINTYSAQQALIPKWQNIVTPNFENCIHFDEEIILIKSHVSYSDQFKISA